MTTITLTTDFGGADAYVGIMKGVILARAPGTALVDLSHAIPPQDVCHGAVVLWSAVEFFASGTVHLAVVDPGVGSARRAIALESGGQLFVGPDNGLLWSAAQRLGIPRAVSLDRKEFFCQPVSSTFHGRDVFAPVAAALACGRSLDEVGSPLGELVPLDLFDATMKDEEIEGKLLGADHFGNLLSNIPLALLEEKGGSESWQIQIGDQLLEGIHNTFSDVPLHEPVAYGNSFGLLEIAIREGSAVARWPLPAGAPLFLRRRQKKR